MPSPIAFLNSYGLHTNVNLTPIWSVESVTSSFKVSTLHEHYTFPDILLTMTSTSPSSTIESATAALRKSISRPSTCYSAYGSPYKTSIANVSVVSSYDLRGAMTVVFSMCGRADRDRTCKSLPHSKSDNARKIPAIKKESVQVQLILSDEDRVKIVAKSASDVLTAHGGFKVIAALEGSMCTICLDPIFTGTLISKRDSDVHLGSWNHVECEIDSLAVLLKTEKEDIEVLMKSNEEYRTIKSMYDTSRCFTCGQAIHKNMKISRPVHYDSEGARGHWSHVHCDALKVKQKFQPPPLIRNIDPVNPYIKKGTIPSPRNR